jgi:hypothetical protein
LQALRTGYKALYARNEFAHRLPRTKLDALVTEITGLEKGSPTVRAIVGTFEALKPFAADELATSAPTSPEPPFVADDAVRSSTRTGLNLSYTVQLNLPATSDIAVFNAIFRSLKENLLE